MKTRSSLLAVLSSLLLFSTANNAAAQQQPLPPPPPAPPLQQPAPSSSAPQLELQPPPFPSEYTPSLPATAPMRSWNKSRDAWGNVRERPEHETAPETQRVWYGWQTLLTDALALTTAFASPEFGLMTYGLGAPIVHWGHGNVGRGFASLGLRAGAPILLGLGGLATCDHSGASDDEHSGWECLGTAAVGVALGMLTAVVIDSSVIARETVPVEKTTIALGPVKMMPSVASNGKQTSLSLIGTF